MRPILALAALSAAVVAAPFSARANCAMPVTYDVKVEGNTVTICPVNFSSRMCPDASGLLREDASSDAVVQVADCDEQACFVDECVAPGTYRYGFADPYSCHSSSCGTSYFSEAVVSAALGSCQRTAGRNPPAAYSGEVPWGDDAQICGYGGLGGCGLAEAAVWPVNALALLGGLLLLSRRRR